MSRRPSATSVSSGAASSSVLQSAKLPPTSSTPSSASWIQRSASISSTFSKQPQTPALNNPLDPDELFTKYSIAEIRNVQLRLRADADAKQEELRLMVGERYRDLLQASTSIISIAGSSKHVLDAINEMKSSIPDPHVELQLPRRPGGNRKDDSHLRTLQSLAAHMKLLLDTPEHLWRLIERKKYLHAGWLFLLARVIHHALIRPAADGDEEDWKVHGIDVEDQFPLVQRQWETISHFKSQISYKATLSLREPGLSVDDICATLLNLHILNSEPLTKILDSFLLQRTRSLQVSLSRSASTANGKLPPQINGLASKPRKMLVREVRDSLRAAFESISLTLGAARHIFLDDPPTSSSLMSRVLSYIQSDNPLSEDAEATLPLELRMSTHNLLSGLPSSSHFNLLPLNIRTYKPYIDVGSSTTTVTPEYLADKLQLWFLQAVQELQRIASGWFAPLVTLLDVWENRRWAKNWVGTNTELDSKERAALLAAVDAVTQAKASEIWKESLEEMESVFQMELQDAISALADGTSDGLTETSPSSFLFRAPPQVSAFDSGLGMSVAASFRKYEAALRNQVAGRTLLLDRVLSVVETRASTLRQDFDSISCDGEDGRSIAKAYQPDADAWCSTVISIISVAVEEQSGESESITRTLAFLTRVISEMSSSRFLEDIRQKMDICPHFEAKMQELHDVAIDRWRNLICDSILSTYIESWTIESQAYLTPKATPGMAALPSSALMHALLALSDAVRTVNVSVLSTSCVDTASMTLRAFILALLRRLKQFEDNAPPHRPAYSWDLRLLRKLAQLHGDNWIDITNSLDVRIAKSVHGVAESNTPPDPEGVITEYITRTQLLISPLLPVSYSSAQSSKPARKDGVLNGFVLTGEQTVQPIIELVKPGPRFGMLLVGSTAIG